MILADADTTGDGVFDERTYYVQNFRHDVVALADASGDVVERTGYLIYGQGVDLLEGDFDRDGNVGITTGGRSSLWAHATR